MMVRRMVGVGVVLELVGLLLFLSVFVSAALNMGTLDADESFRATALAMVRAPIGMGLMAVGGLLMMGGLAWGAFKNAHKLAAALEKANACGFCGAQRGGLSACPSCGARD